MKLSRTLIPVVVVGVGSLAVSGVAVADAATKAPHPTKSRRAPGLLRRVEHGTFVVRRGSKDVSLTIARGTVASVSADAVSVASADGVVTAYVVTATTRVRQLGTGLMTIGSVHTGAAVEVVGRGSGAATDALRIVLARPKA